MVWRQAGDKPLSETMIAYFTEADMGHSVKIIQAVSPGKWKWSSYLQNLSNLGNIEKLSSLESIVLRKR